MNIFRRYPRNVVAPLSKKQYLDAVHRSGEGCFQWLAGVIGCGVFGPDLLEWALLHADGIGCSRGKLHVFDDYHPDADASFHMAAQMIQEMLSHQGTLELLLCGPLDLCEKLRKAFLPGGNYAVDHPCMVTLKVEIVSLFDLPPIRTTQLSDVDFNEGAHHHGPSQQLFTALATMASAEGLPCSLASTKPVANDQQELHACEAVKGNDVPAGSCCAKLQGSSQVRSDVETDSIRSSSERSRCYMSPHVEITSRVMLRASEPAPLIWTPILPLPPLMLEVDGLCMRSKDQGCCVTGGFQVASFIGCFSRIVDRLLEQKKEVQPIVMQPDVTSTITNHKMESAAAPVLQSVALDATILNSRDQNYFGRNRRPSLGRILEVPEEFQQQELEKSTDERYTEASDDSCSSESNSDPLESRGDTSDSLRERPVMSCPRNQNDGTIYSCYSQSGEQSSSKMFKNRVAELKKRVGRSNFGNPYQHQSYIR